MKPENITALILTRDEERNLPRAMTSLPHGVRVFVLDAHSSDGTVAYARGAGASVEERAWTSFLDARTYALSRIETEWTLQLDADEALDDRLRDALAAAPEDVDGFVVRRATFFHGKRMRMWSDEPLVRLVRTKAARFEAFPTTGGTAAVHERLVVNGPTRELPGELLHYSYADHAAYRDKFETYTDIEARGSHANAWREALMLVPRFAKNLIAGGALLDGFDGWFIAWHSALYPLVVALKRAHRA